MGKEFPRHNAWGRCLPGQIQSRAHKLAQYRVNSRAASREIRQEVRQEIRQEIRQKIQRPAWPALLCLALLAGALLFLSAPAQSMGQKWDDLPRQRSSADRNGNGISDTDDIIAGARAYVQTRPLYRSAYYRGGHPPAGEGVCTDVIVAALAAAGYDLRRELHQDVLANRALYKRVSKPDSNIDFRRVPNQLVYFKRHGLSLTTSITPGDRASLAQWQPGDIVTFANPDHVAVLSDRRNSQGLPYLLHNDGPWASEGDDFMYWAKRGITGHFRFPRP